MLLLLQNKNIYVLNEANDTLIITVKNSSLVTSLYYNLKNNELGILQFQFLHSLSFISTLEHLAF